MASIGDVYQIRDYQVMAGDNSNPFLNVYHYEVVLTSVTMDASSVEAAFQGTVGVNVRNVQSTSLQHTLHEVINLMDPTDFISIGFTPPAGQGAVAGDYLPNANCFSFIYRRATRVVRNGWKRIGGLSEASVQNGGAAVGTIVDLTAIATAMESQLVIGAGVLEPRIVRITGPVGGPFVYTPFPISGVDYMYVGTQNTRKR